MKKLVLCIAVLSLANRNHFAYSMVVDLTQQEKLDKQLFSTVKEFRGQEEDTKKIKKLLTDGANPNAIDKESGMAPLHQAILYPQPQVVELLLNAGADLTTKITGSELKDKTPLDLLKRKCIFYHKKLDQVMALIFGRTTPEEVQHIIPFCIALEKVGDLPELPKDIRKLLAKNYLVQAVVNEKLNKAKPYFPEYYIEESVEKLRKAIEEQVITAIKRTPSIVSKQEKETLYPYMTHDADPFGTLHLH